MRDVKRLSNSNLFIRRVIKRMGEFTLSQVVAATNLNPHDIKKEINNLIKMGVVSVHNESDIHNQETDYKYRRYYVTEKIQFLFSKNKSSLTALLNKYNIAQAAKYLYKFDFSDIYSLVNVSPEECETAINGLLLDGYLIKQDQNRFKVVETEFVVKSLPPELASIEDALSLSSEYDQPMSDYYFVAQKLLDETNKRNNATAEKLDKITHYLDLARKNLKLQQQNSPIANAYIDSLLAQVYVISGKFSQARDVGLKVIDLFLKNNLIFEATHLSSLIVSGTNLTGDLSSSGKAKVDIEHTGWIPYLQLGNLYSELNRIEEAESAFREAISKYPHVAASYFNLGHLLSEAKRYKEAENAYRKAIEIDPNMAVAYSNLGDTLEHLNRLEEAENSYREAIKREPTMSVAYYNLGNLLYRERRFEQAEVSFRQAIQHNPKFSAAYYNIATMLAIRNRYSEAEKLFHEAISNDPNDFASFLNLGVIYSRVNRIDDANLAYNRAIELGYKGQIHKPSMWGSTQDPLMDKVEHVIVGRLIPAEPRFASPKIDQSDVDEAIPQPRGRIQKD